MMIALAVRTAREIESSFEAAIDVRRDVEFDGADESGWGTRPFLGVRKRCEVDEIGAGQVLEFDQIRFVIGPKHKSDIRGDFTLRHAKQVELRRVIEGQTVVRVVAKR